MILRRTALQFTERQKDRQMVIQIKLNFFKFGQFFFVLPAIIVLCTQNRNITIQYACSHEHMLLLWRLKWYMLSSFLSSMNLIQNPANFQDICSHPNMLLHWTLKLHLLVISLFQKKKSDQSALLSTGHNDCTIYSWLALSDGSSFFNSATTVLFLTNKWTWIWTKLHALCVPNGSMDMITYGKFPLIH